MKIFIILLTLAATYCEEMVVTREYTDYLKRHVTWEVVDYEDNLFRGWTIEEAKMLLGAKIPQSNEPLPVYEAPDSLPSSVMLEDECVHAPRNQGKCGSCWTFGTTGMLTDRCCKHTGKDQGWVSPQELVSCDIHNDGCQGGWPTWGLQYVIENSGLVSEECFKYQAKELACPMKCDDGSDWKESRKCNCYGLKQCLGVKSIKACLVSGSVAVTFEVPQSFFNYKTGIYKCDGPSLGLHTVTAVGYSDDPECHWRVRNSWGDTWGDRGFFKMSCTSCGMDGKYVNGNAMCEEVK